MTRLRGHQRVIHLGEEVAWQPLNAMSPYRHIAGQLHERHYVRPDWMADNNRQQYYNPYQVSCNSWFCIYSVELRCGVRSVDECVYLAAGIS